ncbi:MAG: PatA/PatG family cyanobactin maturation protease [Dehalococcoidia bacterium]
MHGTDAIALVPGLEALRTRTGGGSPAVRVALLDGPVDRGHPCFAATQFANAHVAAARSPLHGVAPAVTLLTRTIYPPDSRVVSQIDLARSIEWAIAEGAHVINLSAGQYVDSAHADDHLTRAVARCHAENVLLVAAAGNDGCPCLHVPAVLDTVLAVGAHDHDRAPAGLSNWGVEYRHNGLLAPGEHILVAVPGGTVESRSGTSLATPIVAGTAALLLSEMAQRGEPLDPRRAREAMLTGADRCEHTTEQQCDQYLVGILNADRAWRIMTNDIVSHEDEAPDTQGAHPACGCAHLQAGQSVAEHLAGPRVSASLDVPRTTITPPAPQVPAPPPPPSRFVAPSAVEPQTEPDTTAPLVYALGTLGYDFGTEARRDTFKQLMPPVQAGDSAVPANPYDARQMVDYLNEDLSEARSLIWTLNLELTPVYAIEPTGPFAREVFARLRDLMAGQIAVTSDDDYIERVSVPGHITGRTVRLFSGQIVPVIEPGNGRGLYGWRVHDLVSAAIDAAQRTTEDQADEETLRRSLYGFLSRVYYDLRNLGTLSHDRALNFAATNAFQAAHTFATAVVQGMELDSIDVERSPFGRVDSDCWDVKLKFFDPENSRRARRVFRYTVDVSDLMPVTLGDVRSWSASS